MWKSKYLNKVNKSEINTVNSVSINTLIQAGSTVEKLDWVGWQVYKDGTGTWTLAF